MYRRLTLLVSLTIPTAGCFEPDSAADTGGTDGSSGTSDTSGTTSTSNGTTSTSNGTTSSSSNGTSTTTTDATDSATSGPTTASSTGEPEPFCGDGNVDDGEECDDGEDNGSGQACLDDCVLNVCGDGDVGPDEACDEGANNALEVGACAPDCSKTIEERVIVFGGGFDHGALGNNPVAAADGLCDPGFLAMFAFPNVRVATTVPNDSVNPIDWVLEPYTAYTRMDGTPIWITDSVPLLGVRNGSPEPLENTIEAACGMFCIIQGPVITGMNQDWTTPAPLDCNNWTSGSVDELTNYGNENSTTEFLLTGSVDCEFLPDGGILTSARVYCVEQ